MLSISDFLDELRKWGLLDSIHLEELSQKLQGRDLGPRTLACELIERGWLTPFQANQIHLGRGQDLLLGSYVLLERLGEGGMGTVFKARDGKLDRVVAIKLIRKERLNNTNSIRRFQREIRAAALLRHPNIVHALDADEVGGSQLLVMEYVEGIDLARYVADKGPLLPPLAADCIRQTALALAHAHEKGMVHRDIKPSNLLLTGAGRVKLLDLGLARFQAGAEDDSSSTMTESGIIMGTPDFLAPEQARRAHDVDIRADLYSLGCTFYFLLTGRVPFPGGTLGEKIAHHLLDEPIPVQRLRPDVPPRFAAVVRKLMVKQPEQRYQSPAEVAKVLAQGGEPISAARVASESENTVPDWAEVVDPDKTVAYEPIHHQPSPRRRGLFWLLVGTAAALAGLALVCLVLALRLRPGTETQRNRVKEGVPDEDDQSLPISTNSIGMKLAPIPAGNFLMGSPEDEPDRVPHEGPLHEVIITRLFHMGICEVTVGQFRQFAQASGYKTEAEKGGGARRRFPDGKWRNVPQANWRNPGFEQTDAHPVVCVSWNDAQAFCDWLSAREGKRYSLPTEAQWEYACRAGSPKRFSFGDAPEDLDRYGWHEGNADWRTHRVGEKKANAWGLFDMHGNVWEWTADWYTADYYRQRVKKNPPGPPAGDGRVIRGGGWSREASYCRAAHRFGRCTPSHRDADLGFRVILWP
ncbi:MAG TPA: bifunctional serine/threonine-protein kinase/formylglycine-generating enzyme family protein [Gemmataceae bacterium]|jgi:formylglycine-generating enzyme required for sulfatase activity/tRNA A-37 threonylcarbamoyl transferase component Bud32